MYFDNAFPPEFGITPNPQLANRPQAVTVTGPLPRNGQPLHGEELNEFVEKTACAIAARLDLHRR
jgi:threonine synthase